MKLCPIQDICMHFTNGTKRKVHHIRITEPCKHWLLMDCEKMFILAELTQWSNGEQFACNIEKVTRIKKQARATE